MIKRILEPFALWSGVFVLVCAALASLLPYATTGVRTSLTLAMYAFLATATTILAAGHILLIRRGAGSKASVWLTSFTHSKTAQSFAFWGITLLAALRIYGVDNDLLEGLGFAMVGIATGANLMSATVFVLAWREHLLEHQIRPSPIQVLRRCWVRERSDKDQ